MKITTKLIGLSSLALSVAFCGCGEVALPAISSAMRNADATTMKINGRKLIQGIIQANIERAGKASSVWPRTVVEEGAGLPDDVASHAFKSAAEYFNVLFDMAHYGTSDWDPIVDGDLLSTLGKNAVVGNRIDPNGLDWCIAANVTDELQDFIPVLVSANVNAALLPCNAFDGRDSSQLPIGPKSGAERSMLGDNMIVLVRKSGSAETIDKRHANYNVFFNKQAFDNSSREAKIVWLTPSGVAAHP
jgi:hypothetical protein